MARGKVALFMMVSLDGYYASQDGGLEWHNADKEFNGYAARNLDSASVLLFGRKTYELMASFWPTKEAIRVDPLISSRMNRMPKVVFSKTLASAEWENTRLVKNGVAKEMRELKRQNGKDILVLGSNKLAVSLVRMGLLNEVRVIVNPVAIGRGKPLFVRMKKKLKLELKGTEKFKSGNVLLIYNVKKA